MKPAVCKLRLLIHLLPFTVAAQTGSISKPVAAMGALKRVQQGKIALDENINNKLVT